MKKALFCSHSKDQQLFSKFPDFNASVETQIEEIQTLNIKIIQAQRSHLIREHLAVLNC